MDEKYLLEICLKFASSSSAGMLQIKRDANGSRNRINLDLIFFFSEVLALACNELFCQTLKAMLWADFVSPSWIAVQPRLYAAIQMLAPKYHGVASRLLQGGECEEV